MSSLVRNASIKSGNALQAAHEVISASAKASLSTMDAWPRGAAAGIPPYLQLKPTPGSSQPRS